MKKIVLLVALAAAMSMVSAAPAQNGVQPVRPGQTITGALTAADRAYSTGRHFRVFRLDARQGQTYHIALRSADFDALLEVTAPAGPVTERLASDDDTGGEHNALVRFTPLATGPYLLIATSTGGDSAGLGAFELEVREEVIRSAAPRPIAVGDSVRGELGAHSGTTGEATFDLYTFRARSGQRLRIRLAAADRSVPVFFGVGHWTGGRFEPRTAVDRHRVALDADSVPGDGPPVTITIPDDGEYAVRVAAAGAGTRAGYTLQLGEPPLRRSAPRRSAVGPRSVVTDTLTEADPIVDSRRYRTWTYSARAGERITITMRSPEFDTFLGVGYLDADTVIIAETSDDWEDTDSRITITAPQAREYVIYAMSFGSDGGAYTLGVASRLPGAQVVRVGRVELGQEVSGRLEETDAALELDGSPYAHWVYRASAAGERIAVTLRSTDFETFLSMGRMEGGEFREYWSNVTAPDDAEEPATRAIVRRSRVVAVLPAAGDYVIRVNSFSPDKLGRYTLKVERRPLTGAPARTRAAP
jgi:hypothetical protein